MNLFSCLLRFSITILLTYLFYLWILWFLEDICSSPLACSDNWENSSNGLAISSCVVWHNRFISPLLDVLISCLFCGLCAKELKGRQVDLELSFPDCVISRPNPDIPICRWLRGEQACLFAWSHIKPLDQLLFIFSPQPFVKQSFTTLLLIILSSGLS